ncbi:MAG: hypothetical protein HY398_00875 [Candidatus Doudnabacteria bacterium]|nr:hypothetical protein [Candidatus Doudnabacteria bacterium]
MDVRKRNRHVAHPLRGKPKSFRLIYVMCPALVAAVEYFERHPQRFERTIVHWTATPEAVVPETPVSVATFCEAAPKAASAIIARSADVPRYFYGAGSYFR